MMWQAIMPPRHTQKITLLAAAVALLLSPLSFAVEFNIGAVEAQLDSTVTIGAGWRTTGADKDYISPNSQAGGRSNSSNYDDGTLNFSENKTFSKVIKGSHDLELRYQNMGAFIRGSYFYDFEIRDESRDFKPLNDQVRDDSGSGADILDAFIWGDFLIDDMPLHSRFGKQVVNWGESTFIQGGINSINPIDVTAFRKPGAEIKEGLVPVNMIYGSIGLSHSVTVETYYQLGWEKTEIDGCGTYFSTVDVIADGCGPIDTAFGSIDRDEDIDARDSGQYGVALKWYAEELNNTEFGLYYLNYHSRLPYISGTVANAPTNVASANYYIEYPEDIEVYGLSFNTGFDSGYSFAGEYSFRPDMPVQYNAADLLTLAVFTPQTGLPGASVPISDLAGAGESAQGYDFLDISQLQFTSAKFFDHVGNADRLTVVGEVGGNVIHSYPDRSEARYGRLGVFGLGQTDPESGCLAVNTVSPGECNDEGFVTRSAWGYRIKGVLSYNNAFSGINLKPSVSWLHDVNGTSANGQFIDDRKAISFGVTADYLNQISAEFSYTNFMGDRYNVMRDRDFVALSLSYAY